MENPYNDIYAERRALYQLVARLEGRILTLQAEIELLKESNKRREEIDQKYYNTMVEEKDAIIKSLKMELERYDATDMKYWKDL